LGSLREGENLENLDVDGRIILNWCFKAWKGRMDWVDLSQDRKKWRDLVNAIINLWVL
jgi:hypothetical protein